MSFILSSESSEYLNLINALLRIKMFSKEVQVGMEVK